MKDKLNSGIRKVHLKEHTCFIRLINSNLSHDDKVFIPFPDRRHGTICGGGIPHFRIRNSDISIIQKVPSDNKSF
jgi:hypothetical protein